MSHKKRFCIKLSLALLVLLCCTTRSHAQTIKTYTYDHTPALGPFPPTSLPAIGTVFTGVDPWGLPWFAGDPDTTYAYPIFANSGTTTSPTISDQMIHEKVINFCGQTGVQFRITSGAETDLSYLFLSPNSNPEFATEILALESGETESIPASTAVDPVGGVFFRAYFTDDADTGNFFVDWWSDQQPFWKPLNSGDFVAINTYGSTVQDSVVCFGDSTTIFLDNSDLGVSYALRNDANDSIIDGPYLGNGGALGFNTGPVDSTSMYNVLSLGPNDALFYDGVDDHVIAPNNPELDLTDGTIELWIRPFSTAGNQTFLAFEDPGETLTRYSFHFLPGLSGIGFDNGSSVETISYSFEAEVWQQVSIVDNGSNTEVFVDGVSIGNFPTQFGTASDASMNLFLGGNGGLTEMFNGDMEEVRIWDVIKSSSEIIADSDSCLMGSENGLVACYKFEDGYGSSTLSDVSTAANDGTLTNMDVNTNWVSSNPETCTSCDIQMFEVSTVYNPYLETATSICEGDSIFLEDAWQTTGGIYYDTLVSVELGCDSIIETTLSIDPVYTISNEIINICYGDSALIFGNYHDTAGVFVDSLTSVSGCDSVVYQELQVDTIYFEELPDQYICPGDSVLVFDDYVTVAGVYTDTLSTVAGCDSVQQITLQLTTIPPVGIVDYSTPIICSGGEPIMTPLASPSGGVYSGDGVSGMIFDPEELSPGIYYTTYTYTSNHGCENSDSSGIQVVDCLGVGDFGDGQEITVYPNPNNGSFNLKFSYIDEPIQVGIYNMMGELVYRLPVLQENEYIELPDPQTGIYLMVISSDKGVAYRQIVVD